MLCPKDRKTPLQDDSLAESLAVKRCDGCKGIWLPSAEYEAWQAKQPPSDPDPSRLLEPLEVDFVQSPYDTKAALCPECGSYLSRAKISLEKPFYVERCANCGGIWCDRGEWDVLEKLGFHRTIQTLFTQEWQAKVRRCEMIEQERQAMIDKLGQDLAERIFALAEVLEKHPAGDFGVAYLMRRFEE